MTSAADASTGERRARQASRTRWQETMRGLDAVPPRRVVAIGAAVGLALGSLALLAYPAGAAGFVALLVAAGWLAVTGRPVSVLVQRDKQPAALPEPTENDDEAARAGEAPPDDARPDPLVFPPVMADIPAGSFLMGSPDDDPDAHDNEKPRHRVELDGFSCMVYPVTRALYARVTGSDPGYPERGKDAPPVEQDDRAANRVSWYDAVRFCNALSERFELAPCYEIDGESVSWHVGADGYRLPTEAEWEYACRAGATTRYCFGDDAAQLGEYAWFDMESDAGSQPVGGKKPNAWGLHDVHGNVWEWCWDWYDEGLYARRADTAPVRNPTGPTDDEKTTDAAKSVNTRLLRGGAFFFRAWYARCAVRFRIRPVIRVRVTGFRCVRGPRRQH